MVFCQALRAQGSSLEEFLAGWAAAEESIGQELNEDYLSVLRETLDAAQTKAADFDQSGEMNTTDVRELLIASITG